MKGTTKNAELSSPTSTRYNLEDLEGNTEYENDREKCKEYCMGEIMGLPDYCRDSEKKCNSSSATSFGLCRKCFTVESRTATFGLNCE